MSMKVSQSGERLHLCVPLSFKNLPCQPYSSVCTFLSASPMRSAQSIRCVNNLSAI